MSRLMKNQARFNGFNAPRFNNRCRPVKTRDVKTVKTLFTTC
jgi:hypothetical protein